MVGGHKPAVVVDELLSVEDAVVDDVRDVLVSELEVEDKETVDVVEEELVVVAVDAELFVVDGDTEVLVEIDIVLKAVVDGVFKEVLLIVLEDVFTSQAFAVSIQ